MNCSKEEFLNVLDKIYNDMIYQIEKEEIPKAYILGGQPGAGKTTIIDLLVENNSNLIVINGDEFRKKHPHYRELVKKYGDEAVLYTQKFAGKITEALINKLSDSKYSIVVEGTLRTVEVPEKTKTLLEQKGYEAELSLILVKPEFSYLSTLLRYEEMQNFGTIPRMTPKEHHDLVSEKIIENISLIYNKKIFKRLTIYNREKRCLYSLKDAPNTNPAEIFLKEFSRNLTHKELENIVSGYEKVLFNMDKRDAEVSEKEKIKELLENFKKYN